MSDLTVPPTNVQPATSGDNAGAVPPRSQPSPQATATIPSDAGVPTDTVTLSPAAQSLAGDQAAAADLTTGDANAQSLSLRQLLANQPLSGSARQNQAILSLLR